MTKNKIILFGIDPNQNITLFHADDAIYVKQNQAFLKLYFTDDFKQFEKVTDVSITAKLK